MTIKFIFLTFLAFLALIGIIMLITNLTKDKFVNNNYTQRITNLTNNWINAVTVKNDEKHIASLFCKDANLFGSISTTNRTGSSIEQYFKYFANIPGIKVLDRKYNIRKIKHDVYINSALVKWKWDAINDSIFVRMTFVFKGDCITHLHGSGLPDEHDDLKNTNYPSRG